MAAWATCARRRSSGSGATPASWPLAAAQRRSCWKRWPSATEAPSAARMAFRQRGGSMTVVLSRVSVVLLGAALLAASGAACARNDKLLLPVDVAMRNPATRAVLGSDIALRFGRASGGGETAFVQVHSVADPFSSPTATGNRFRRADEVVCQDAFRKALA